MELYTINPFIRYCQTIPRPRSHTQREDRPVCTYDCRLFYILSGECIFEVNETKLSLAESSLLYIPSGTPYKLSYEATSPLVTLIVNFDFDQTARDRPKDMKPVFPQDFDVERQIRAPESGPFSKPILIKDFPALHPLLSETEREFLSGSLYKKEYASSQIRQVLISILREQEFHTNAEETLSHRIKNYIKQNYSKEITAASLGQQFGYHPYHLNRIFKKYIGTTLHQYHIQCRIHAAKTMLRSTDLTIEEISEAVGISEQAHFSYCFKKEVGLSPTEYRTKKGIRYL